MYLKIDMTQIDNLSTHEYTFFIELNKDGMKELTKLMNELSCNKNKDITIMIDEIKMTQTRLTNW